MTVKVQEAKEGRRQHGKVVADQIEQAVAHEGRFQYAPTILGVESLNLSLRKPFYVGSWFKVSGYSKTKCRLLGFTHGSVLWVT